MSETKTQFRDPARDAAIWVLALLFLPVTIAWSGFILCMLWQWYAVPLGLASISVGHALGLVLIARAVGGLPNRKSSDDPLEELVEMTAQMIRGGLVLAMGWGLSFLV